MKLVIATAAALELVTTTPMHAASEMACMVMWDKADVYKNGTLEGNEATTIWMPSERAARRMN